MSTFDFQICHCLHSAYIWMLHGEHTGRHGPISSVPTICLQESQTCLSVGATLLENAFLMSIYLYSYLKNYRHQTLPSSYFNYQPALCSLLSQAFDIPFFFIIEFRNLTWILTKIVPKP